MRSLKSSGLNLMICFVALVLAMSMAVYGQNTNEFSAGEPKLLGSIDNFKSGEEGSLLLDLLRVELDKGENGRGAVFIFCGKVCQYGEVEAHLNGVRRELNTKKFVAEQIILVAAGYREKTTVEFWYVPPGQCLPMPNSTIKLDDVKMEGKFPKTIVPYECCYEQK